MIISKRIMVLSFLYLYIHSSQHENKILKSYNLKSLNIQIQIISKFTLNLMLYLQFKYL